MECLRIISAGHNISGNKAKFALVVAMFEFQGNCDLTLQATGVYQTYT